MEKSIWYFDGLGTSPGVTRKTLGLARRRTDELHIKDVVIASTTGATAVSALKHFQNFNLVAVTQHYGYKELGKCRLTKENRKKLQGANVKIIFATPVLAGIDRSLHRMWGGITPVQLIGQVLKMFGDGLKVCVEIAVMAADAGTIPVDREIIAIAGTSRHRKGDQPAGADTAIVLRPTHSNDFFGLGIQEIICIPRIRPKMRRHL